MAVAITVTPDPTYARNRVTVTGATATEVTVTRTGSDNSVIPVRSADPLYPIGGTAEIFDYESEFGVPNTYTVTNSLSGVDTTATATATLNVFVSWLKAPSFPALNVPVRFTTYPRLSKTRPYGAHNVLGRATPIVATGTMSSYSGDLELLTGNEASSRALRQLLDTAERIFLQVPVAQVGSRYFAVTGYEENAFTRFLFEDTFLWRVSVIEVDRPSGDLFGNPTASYDSLKSGVATYTALKTNYASYQVVTRGVGSIIPPPNPGGF